MLDKLGRLILFFVIDFLEIGIDNILVRWRIVAHWGIRCRGSEGRRDGAHRREGKVWPPGARR